MREPIYDIKKVLLQSFRLRKNFDFLRTKLVDLISNKNLEKVTKDLKADELIQFCSDVDNIKKVINTENGMESSSYLKAKELTLEDYEDFIENERGGINVPL